MVKPLEESKSEDKIEVPKTEKPENEKHGTGKPQINKDANTDEEDELVIKLLKILDEYETLSETFKTGFQESFLDLSKKKLNYDFVIDLRPRLAALNVNGFKLVDLLKEEDIEKPKSKASEDLDKSISLIRNRLSKTTILKDSTEEIKEPELAIANPLDQFGLVNMKPLQQKFIDNITTTIELHKKRIELQELLEKLHV